MTKIDKRTKAYRQYNKQVVLVCLSCGRRWLGYDRLDNICGCRGINIPTDIVIDNTLTVRNNYITK